MKSILEELYYNDCNSASNHITPGSPYALALAETNKAYRALKAQLDETQLVLLNSYIEAEQNTSALSDIQQFISAFRLGARFGIALYGGEEGPFHK